VLPRRNSGIGPRFKRFPKALKTRRAFSLNDNGGHRNSTEAFARANRFGRHPARPGPRCHAASIPMAAPIAPRGPPRSAAPAQKLTATIVRDLQRRNGPLRPWSPCASVEGMGAPPASSSASEFFQGKRRLYLAIFSFLCGGLIPTGGSPNEAAPLLASLLLFAFFPQRPKAPGRGSPVAKRASPSSRVLKNSYARVFSASSVPAHGRYASPSATTCLMFYVQPSAPPTSINAMAGKARGPAW